MSGCEEAVGADVAPAIALSKGDGDVALPGEVGAADGGGAVGAVVRGTTVPGAGEPGGGVVGPAPGRAPGGAGLGWLGACAG